jgi:DNA-binding transcriptional MerR regulator
MLTSEIARLIAVSPASVRVYARKYAKWLSPTAVTVKGATRNYTEQDARLMGFVASLTAQGIPHGEIETRIEASEHEAFDLPSSSEPSPEQVQVEQTALAVLIGQAQASVKREADLHDRIATLEREVGQAQGELTALKAQLEADRERQRQPWYRRLFGM